jgi:hypothetical protein
MHASCHRGLELMPSLRCSWGTRVLLLRYERATAPVVKMVGMFHKRNVYGSHVPQALFNGTAGAAAMCSICCGARSM